MARRTPVITSNKYTIPEIVKDGALLIYNPQNEKLLTEK